MPIHGIEYHSSATDQWTSLPPPPNEEDGQRYVGGPKGTFEFMYADVPGSSWTAPRVENARQWIQANVFDVRIDRATLHPDHPYVAGGDPAQEHLFWDGGDVVERFIVIDEIIIYVIDGFEIPRCTLRRIHTIPTFDGGPVT